MLRDTMISTMPVAMIAIDVLCTDRFHRFRAVRKSPPDRTLKLIQITAVARIMPTIRESISADARPARQPDFEAVAGTGPACVSVIVTPSLHHIWTSTEVPPAFGRGALPLHGVRRQSTIRGRLPQTRRRLPGRGHLC